MRKAILTKFIHLLFLALVLNTFIALVVTSSVLLKRSREDMHFALESVDRMLDYTGNVEEQLMDLSELTNDNNSRYTLIRMDGTVVADTEVAQVNQMENHLERKEVKDALATGYGYSVRRSGTLGMQMAYAAIRSSDGKYILRLSACSTGLGEYILMLIPAAFLSFGIAFFASAMEAERFSQSITRPLQEISSEMVRMDDDYTRFQFEKCPYEEINVIADTTTRMSRNMKKYLERIEKEKQIRQEFFSNASHELKTPLTAIRGYAELLQSGMASDTQMQKEFLGRIHSEVEEMTSLINDILMISRLETKELMPTKEMLCVKSVAEEVKKTLKPLADENNVSLEIHCCDEFVYMDRSHLQGILSNLMGNAVKYNRPGGFVQTDITMDSTSLSIRVEDSGIGIAKEDQKRIFERFYRVDKGRSKRVAGTGLGLSIVKHVTEFYGGCVSVESQSGVGSTFLVQLPAASLVQK